MGVLSSGAWLFGILFLLGGFLFLVSSMNSSNGNVSRVMIGILAILIGAILCYAGNKLKGSNSNNANASRDGPDDDSGGRPWWKPDPKYDGARIDQQQRRLGWK